MTTPMMCAVVFDEPGHRLGHHRAVNRPGFQVGPLG
jgi:hypothetical protein